MVVLAEKLNKFYSKMENLYLPHHHREDHDDAEASIKVFRSKVSNFLIEKLLRPKPRSGNLSFSWIKRCLELVSVSDKAFAKLVVEMNHPMSNWDAFDVDEYLNYTLNMPDLLNLVSSSISHLGHARLELCHALMNTSEILKPMEMKIPTVLGLDLRKRAKNPGSDTKRLGSKKDRVIHEGLIELQSIGFWVCGVVLSALVGDSRPYVEVKKLALGFSGSLLGNLNLGDFEERAALEEVEDLKNGTASAIGIEDAERLKRKLEEVEKGIEEIGEVVDELFSRILAGRNQILDTIKLV